MEIHRLRVIAARNCGIWRFRIDAPLDEQGQASLSTLTTETIDSPAKLDVATYSAAHAIFLDEELEDVLLVRDRGIRNGRITARSQEAAEETKILLSSGPMPVRLESTRSGRSAQLSVRLFGTVAFTRS